MRFIFPPRPESKIRPADLEEETSRGGWIWQPKYEGDRSPIDVNGKAVSIFNQDGDEHTDRKFSPIKSDLASLGLPPAVYLDGEYMQSLALVVLFDALKIEKYLLGVTQMERLKMLENLCGNPTKLRDDLPALFVTDHVALAPYGDSDFVAKYKELSQHRLIEGLVLRKKNSILDNYGGQKYEVNWQLRCRRPSKMYRH